jgi:hypothetical protein
LDWAPVAVLLFPVDCFGVLWAVDAFAFPWPVPVRPALVAPGELEGVVAGRVDARLSDEFL